MKYYSTNRRAPEVSLKQAIQKGLAPDNGLYMPGQIGVMPCGFLEGIENLTYHEIAFRVANTFFGEDVPHAELQAMVADTLSFDTPVVRVRERIWSLELFHGPTAAFKDIGARFMARMLSHFISQETGAGDVTVLVATSGDTGSAVANGFLGVKGINVIILYPKGKVSDIQEKQFTTLGHNITAIEVDGTFDDCQRLVKSAFLDAQLNEKLTLTSANSINVARFLPQAFYYFYGYALMKRAGHADNLVVSVPSGNFGNLTAGLFAARMGLPVKRFIAANNSNDMFFRFLQNGNYEPRPSIQTIANAMDVGDPSNFARILDFYGHDIEAIRNDISGCCFSDEAIGECMSRVLQTSGYMLDPHGACAYLGLEKELQEGETGLLLETAHPAKFLETVESVTGESVTVPESLKGFMSGQKQSIPMSRDFEALRDYLLSRA